MDVRFNLQNRYDLSWSFEQVVLVCAYLLKTCGSESAAEPTQPDKIDWFTKNINL